MWPTRVPHADVADARTQHCGAGMATTPRVVADSVLAAVPWATETSLTELVPGCSRNHSMRCSSRARTCNATFICRKRAAFKGDQRRGVATDAKPSYLVDGNIAIQHLAGANTTSAQTNIKACAPLVATNTTRARLRMLTLATAGCGHGRTSSSHLQGPGASTARNGTDGCTDNHNNAVIAGWGRPWE